MMPGERIFKLIVKSEGQPSANGLKYIYNNIDIINEMGIQVKITVVDSDSLDRETVDTFNSRGITSFPAIITDNGKVRNGVEDIKDLFERNKKNYMDWMDKQRSSEQPRGRTMGERGPDYTFGGDEHGISTGGVHDFYAREMNLDSYKKDQKDKGDDMIEGTSVNGDDYNRRIADWNRRTKPPPRKPQVSFDSGGGDPEEEFDNAPRSTVQRGGTIDEPENNIVPRGDDLFESRFMEGIDDKAYAGDY